jgi:hypothetical protein
MVSLVSFGQNTKQLKRGYFSIGIGPSIHTSGIIQYGNVNQGIIQQDTDPKISAGSLGLNFNFIDAAYSFDQNWGVALKIQGGFFTNKANRKILKSNFGAIMIGPMYSYEINDVLVIDLKAKAGRFFNLVDFTDEFSNAYRESEFDFGMELGSTVRYHLSETTSWINNIDFQNQFGENNNRINRINVSTGIGIRF